MNKVRFICKHYVKYTHGVEQPLHIIYCVMAAGVMHEFYAYTSGVLALVLVVNYLGGEANG